MSQPQWLEEILMGVERPGRYIGGEWGEMRKNPAGATAKIALIFPDVYEIGMSYLGQKIVYDIFNRRPLLLAERVFAPWPDMEQVLRTKNIPLFSLENKIPLSHFDVLGFSLLYELNYSNIMTILDLGHIPFFSTQRDLSFPLVIAGGPAAFNPEPLACFFDLFLAGDGEEAFPEIVEKYMALKKEGEDKDVILKELAKINGVYVPSLYEAYVPLGSPLLAVQPINRAPAKVEKRIFSPFSRTHFPERIIVPHIQVVFDRVAVEAARGCPQRCRFCQATSIYFPFRIKDPSFLFTDVLSGLVHSGYEDSSLSSLSISDYPYLDETVEKLMAELEKEKISLSLSSLRPKGLSHQLAESITRVRRTGFTLVPEAGTERLRRVINKNLSDEEILKASENAFSQGWRLLKLYFMVGLPTEMDEDLIGIAELVQEIVRIGRRILGHAPRVNLSLSPFIPKPHTPFQWLAMEEEAILKEKRMHVKSRLKKFPFVKIKEHSVKQSVLECVFSRGDRRLNAPLVQAWKRGARFDSWKDYFHFPRWEEAFAAEGIDYRTYLGSLEKETVLPWDHMDTGLKKSYLLRELERAFREEMTPSCLEQKCGDCLGCNFQNRVKKLFEERVEPQWKAPLPFGLKTEKVVRYQVVFEKRGPARFLSHLDLTSLIQRAFRRARIGIAYSEGFHPKMLMSFSPALPLGMEGREEILEFKSSFRFAEKDFLSRMNEFLLSGVAFSKLLELDDSEPSLARRLGKMVYSVDLRSREICEAVEKEKKKRNLDSSDDMTFVETLLEEFLRDNSTAGETIEKAYVDREANKLFLYMQYFPQGGARPRDVVSRILRVDNPVFSMGREKIII